MKLPWQKPKPARPIVGFTPCPHCGGHLEITVKAPGQPQRSDEDRRNEMTELVEKLMRRDSDIDTRGEPV